MTRGGLSKQADVRGEARWTEPNRMPPLLLEVWLGTIGLFLLSAGFCMFCYLRHRSAMYWWPLSVRMERYGDFPIYLSKFKYFGTEAFFTHGFPFTYPAPVSLVYAAFYRLFPTHSLDAFLVFTVLAFCLPAVLFIRALYQRGLSIIVATGFGVTLLLLSWPALLILDRGNMEVVVWLLLATGMWAFATGRGYLAAVLFGAAASAKLFPFVLLCLFLSLRQYKQLALGVLAFLVISLVSLALLGPTIPLAYSGIQGGLDFFRLTYMTRWHTVENGVDHSLFAFLKMAIFMYKHYPKDHVFLKPLQIYFDCTALAGVLFYFLRIRFLPLLNQVLVLSIIAILFTPFSGDGTLVHLYYPFAMLLFFAIEASRRGIHIRGLRASLLSLTFLFSLASYLVRRTSDIPPHRIEGEVKCVVLVYLLYLGLRWPLGPALRDTNDSRVLANSESIPSWSSIAG